jgi:hypothetical protein
MCALHLRLWLTPTDHCTYLVYTDLHPQHPTRLPSTASMSRTSTKKSASKEVPLGDGLQRSVLLERSGYEWCGGGALGSI